MPNDRIAQSRVRLVPEIFKFWTVTARKLSVMTPQLFPEATFFSFIVSFSRSAIGIYSFYYFLKSHYKVTSVTEVT